MPLKVLLNGAKGRMGQAILAIAADENAVVTHAVDMGDDASSLLPECDVVIDFSFHTATLPLALQAAKAQKPLVIGTTGHTVDERKAIAEAVATLPVVWAGNYSVGVNLLFFLVEKAASILDQRYHPEVIEMHHRHKKDAPSGTAEGLVAAILSGRQWSADCLRHGRSGITGERPDIEIGVHALRGGDVVGDHTVLFAGEGERLELTHKASDRAIFARGAVRAAHWVQQQPAGMYSMLDVLNLS